jgi:endogenous inhibitor of DNA gyrase (YacG/DUF329 family)
MNDTETAIVKWNCPHCGAANEDIPAETSVPHCGGCGTDVQWEAALAK